jgi:hypothetical protein
MRDTNLALKAAGGSQTTSTTGSWVDFGGPDITPITIVVNVTAVANTTGTMALVIEESGNGSAVDDWLAFETITAVGVYRMTAKLDGRYRRYRTVMGGTSPGFTFTVDPELGGQYEKR